VADILPCDFVVVRRVEELLRAGFLGPGFALRLFDGFLRLLGVRERLA